MRTLRLTHEQAKGVKCPHVAPADEQFIYIDGDSECWKLHRARASDNTRSAATKPSAPAHGPGTEIAKMFKLIVDDPNCKTCGLRAAKMNQWGVQGCREHRDQIIGWLTKAAKDRGWMSVLAAGINAAKHGLPLTIGGLVDEAIRRADAKCCADGQCTCGRSSAANSSA